MSVVGAVAEFPQLTKGLTIISGGVWGWAMLKWHVQDFLKPNTGSGQ